VTYSLISFPGLSGLKSYHHLLPRLLTQNEDKAKGDLRSLTDQEREFSLLTSSNQSTPQGDLSTKDLILGEHFIIFFV
jgi:hypothetical protein